MKKTFITTHKKIKTARLFEGFKHEISKYLKRERRKTLPDGYDYWDFNCRFGKDAEHSEAIHVSAINKSISWAETEQLKSFYLEVIAEASIRTKKPITEQDTPSKD